MAASGSTTASAIAPGSVPYGERAGLEQGIISAMAGGGGAPGGGAPGGAPPAPQLGNPIQDMLSGAIQPSDNPLTSGMSVGPGSSPQDSSDIMLSDRAERLRQVALQATSPQLRLFAIRELRRMARGVV